MAHVPASALTDIGPLSPRSVAAAAVGLTCATATVGALGTWASPERITTGWQIADVPPSLLGLTLATAVICLALAALMVRPRALPGRVLPAIWWAAVVTAAGALVWNDLFLAALGTTGDAAIPVLDWLFTLLPAAVVGLATRGADVRTQLRALLGTAVVTLPLYALGWGLFSSAEDWPAAINAVRVTALLGGIPLLITLVTTRRWRSLR
ncbi:hypothetical protein [Modestobacter italicus]|uniref:hypothetical protein n=1 Tax=Modestobacter italicus (strain DSM 44449 / CECT 9708 / BC 501) TaxID=2732864 RepID=UPI001411BC28|nr:hypothetical protein [Modestobacter marinus]